MISVAVRNFEHWRDVARALLSRQVVPDGVVWSDVRGGQLPLADDSERFGMRAESAQFSVPKRFIELARYVACHSSGECWPLLYRVLWRLTHGESKLLDDALDVDIHRMSAMEKSVRRDEQKMHAFTRFRELEHGWFVSWFEPEHFIVELTAQFFVSRFVNMRWSILTPRGCASWDGEELVILPPASKPDDASPESLEATWRTYYSSIFNPARLNVRAMQKEMPAKHWRNLPEAHLISGLVKEAPRRVGTALETAGSVRAAPRGRNPWTPSNRPIDEQTLESIKEAAESCQDCPLWQTGTQTVFGAGDENAKVMFVGEQPGDEEDVRGEPFVGPAGRLLDRALVDAKVDRSRVYVTNAVKHFKWEPRGKRRLHKTPAQREIDACHQWLERELAIIKPEVVVCLGSTAANSVLGGKVKILANRGKFLTGPGGLRVLITVHPSSVLRAPEEQRELAYQALVNDLKEINRAIA